MMIGRVVVLPQQEFQAWMGGGASEGTLAQAGEKLFTDLACVTCHRAGSGQRGPLLNGVFGSTVQLASGGTVTADVGYIRESILNPQAKVVAGYLPIMPTFQGQVSEEQLLALTEYIRSLPATGREAAPSAAPGAPAGGTASTPGPTH
jgi:cytochrome c oxidase subunit 2